MMLCVSVTRVVFKWLSLSKQSIYNYQTAAMISRTKLSTFKQFIKAKLKLLWNVGQCFEWGPDLIVEFHQLIEEKHIPATKH